MLDRTKVLTTVTALLTALFVSLPVAQGQANANEIQTRIETVRTITLSQIALLTADNYIGTPYCRGGESPRCFDCSGFIQYVYKTQGIDLPRTVTGQYRVAVHITADELQPGDLVFFYSKSGHFYHVGIYVGDGKVLHAPRRGTHVRVESIWTSRVKYGRI